MHGMDDTSKLQQKAFKEYWDKCRPYHATLLASLVSAGSAAERSLALTAYLERTKPFYSAYHDYLNSIGYNIFKSGND
jgi:hypothetical protein